MSLVDAERAIARICLDAEPDDALRAVSDRARWSVYRSMVRHRLVEMITAGMPLTARALGAPRLESLAAAFLAERPPRTRFIREVVEEFDDFAQPRLRADATLPPALADLATLERARWSVGYDPQTADPVDDDFDFDAPCVVAPAHRIVRLEHALLPTPEELLTAERRSTVVLVYRRGTDHRTESRTLSPAFGFAFEELARGQRAAKDCLRAGAERAGVPFDGAFVGRFVEALSEWIERGLVLGSKRP